MEIRPLGEFLALNLGQLAPLELEISEGIKNYLVSELNLDPYEVAVPVDINEDNVISKIEDEVIYLEFVGKFFPPRVDKTGEQLDLQASSWQELISNYLENQEIQYEFDETESELINFTLTAPAFNIESEPSEEVDEDKEEPDQEQDEKDESVSPGVQEEEPEPAAEEEPDEAEELAPEEEETFDEAFDEALKGV